MHCNIKRNLNIYIEIKYIIQVNSLINSYFPIKVNTYISSSTKRIFLFSASIAFISPSVSEKSNICTKNNFVFDFIEMNSPMQIKVSI